MRPEIRSLVGVALLTSAALAAAGEPARVLRVCADPNNLPFSNRAGEGFENVLAEMLADDLAAEVEYTWWAQRRGFVRNTLNAGACDVIMGVPAEYELVDTTHPYYCSTYVFVQREDGRAPVDDIRDPRLRELTIGVHLTGDDGANPPPAHALGRLGIVDNVVGYMIYGDYRQPNPPARLIEAVDRGEVDVAAAWGPIGGYFAQHADPPLAVHPITGTEAVTRLPFRFRIAVGVRKGDDALRDRMQEVLDRRRDEIRDLLERYRTPLVSCSDS